MKGIPDGFHTITPYMVIKDAADAIDFYEQAFGATEIFRWADPDGRIRHAEIRIGDSPVMITDESPQYEMYSPQTLGNSPVSIFLYVEDVDAFADRAVAAGAALLMALENHDDGDRRGGLKDPFGYTWWIASHINPISREELQKRYDAKG